MGANPQPNPFLTRSPNQRTMANPDVTASINDFVCGDRIHLYARIEGNRITESTFLAYGCGEAFLTANVLTKIIYGKTINEIAVLNINNALSQFTANPHHCIMLAMDIIESLVYTYRH